MSDDTPDQPGQPELNDGGRDASRNTLSPRDNERRAELHAAACEYISQGFEVFPLSYVTDQGLCSVAGTPHCKCKDLDHAGKCQILEHWSEEASSDRDQIDDWWGPAPRYDVLEGVSFKGTVKVASAGDHVLAPGWYPLGNIGLSMRNTHIIGVDIDPRHGGNESVDALAMREIDLITNR